MLQPPLAKSLQTNTSSNNALVDVSFFSSSLSSTCLSAVTASTNAPRNQVTPTTWSLLPSRWQIYFTIRFSFAFSAQVESCSLWRRSVVSVGRLKEPWLAASSVWDASTHTATFQSKPKLERRHWWYVSLFHWDLILFDTDIIQLRGW